MATLESLIHLIRPHVRNCPDPVVTDQLIIAAREFCRYTKWLRETIAVATTAGTQVYGLTSAAADQEVIGIKQVTFQNMQLSPSSPEEVSSNSGTPAVYWFLPSQAIALNPAPNTDAAEDLKVTAIVQPKPDAAAISDELVLAHDQTIASGAMRRLFMMPGAAWFNGDLADVHRAAWTVGINKARSDADRQHRAYAFRTTPGW